MKKKESCKYERGNRKILMAAKIGLSRSYDIVIVGWILHRDKCSLSNLLNNRINQIPTQSLCYIYRIKNPPPTYNEF